MSGERFTYGEALIVYGYDLVKKLFPRARPFLVAFGDGLRQEVGPDVWTRPVEQAIRAAPGASFVISDCRYANEAALVRALGGVVVEVRRPGVGPANETERASLASFEPDLVVENDGTLEELGARLDALLGLE